MKRVLAAGVLFFQLFFNALGVSAFAVSDSQDAKANPSQAQNISTLKEITVKATAESSSDTPFMKDVDGTKIYAGKKTSQINLAKDMPAIANNNWRQAVSKIPGLLVSEESTPLFSVGYRGLEPHRAQFIQVLKDGVPIHADMFGYPEAYYVPALQTIEKIEFVRGGAGLMYGPQPGGAMNFVTHMPVTDKKIELNSENLFGSDSLFSTYESLTGKLGPVSYLGYFHERQGEGFRQDNSDYEVINGGMKVMLNQDTDSQLTMNYDEYHEEHGEPGGLTRAQFDADPSVNTRQYDRFRLERSALSFKYEKQVEDKSQFDLLTYLGRYRRYSKRQRGGGFGTLPTGVTATTNDVETQDFYNLGFEPRLRHNYEWFDEEHTLSAGMHTFMSHSPRDDERGGWPDADSGTLRKEATRDSWYTSLFLENLFRIGKFSITPGVRLENLWQRINEKLNLDKTTVPLVDTTEYDFEPLFGLGVAYEVAKAVEIYTNISQSYRPKIFTQAVPVGTNQVINEDLEEGKGTQYDFGLRGKPLPFFSWDINYFIMTFSNQIGTSGSTVTNSGRALYQGSEIFAETDLIGAMDYFKGTEHGNRLGALSPFVSLMFLDAEFGAGPFDGRRPQYAPQYNLRTGIGYKWQERFKANFSGTFLDDHFADDSNTTGASSRYIPSYKVWDLTAELNLLENVKNAFDLSIFGGINNIFDEKYYSRVRADGIDPANDRNIYGGVKIKLG